MGRSRTNEIAVDAGRAPTRSGTGTPVREGQGYAQKTDGLLLLGQAFIAFVTEFHDVVRCAHAKHTQGEGNGQPRGSGRYRCGTEEQGTHRQGQEVARIAAGIKSDPPWWGTAFMLVSCRSFLTNQLAKLERLHLLNEHRQRGEGMRNPKIPAMSTVIAKRYPSFVVCSVDVRSASAAPSR